MISSMLPTFLASLRAVGTASTMAFAGVYLHRRYVHVFFTFISLALEKIIHYLPSLLIHLLLRNFVTPSGKKMLALISQQVTKNSIELHISVQFVKWYVPNNLYDPPFLFHLVCTFIHR